MKATKIKMKSGCRQSENLLEIDSIYLEGYPKSSYYKKDAVYDFIKNQDRVIYVNVKPYPRLKAVLNGDGEKYVCAETTTYSLDDLLNLPRE